MHADVRQRVDHLHSSLAPYLPERISVEQQRTDEEGRVKAGDLHRACKHHRTHLNRYEDATAHVTQGDSAIAQKDLENEENERFVDVCDVQLANWVHEPTGNR
jgi:hypothetical protein